MDQKKLNEAIDRVRDEPTPKLVALFMNANDGQTEEFREAVRRTLIVRGVSDPSAYTAQPVDEPPHHSHAPLFAVIGALVGGFVGYLIGKPPLLSFEHVITRGATLENISAILRPAAEQAFDWLVARPSDTYSMI